MDRAALYIALEPIGARLQQMQEKSLFSDEDVAATELVAKTGSADEYFLLTARYLIVFRAENNCKMIHISKNPRSKVLRIDKRYEVYQQPSTHDNSAKYVLQAFSVTFENSGTIEITRPSPDSRSEEINNFEQLLRELEKNI
jgi:hypothetical protein